MRVTSLNISQFKSIAASGELTLGPITVLVGRNNSGKSTVLAALHLLQGSAGFQPGMVRLGADQAVLDFRFSEFDTRYWGREARTWDSALLQFTGYRNGSVNFHVATDDGGSLGLEPIVAREPNHFVVPYLSKRKVTTYDETINSDYSSNISVNLNNLAAKVDRLSDSNHPRFAEFQDSVREVIGLRLSAIASPNGKQVGVWVNDTEWIRLEEMGDGVAQMLGLIVQLCVARGKLFLIEELENDIHPEGLKALLRLIEKRSHENQFVISTHNNVVLRHLGAVPSTILYEVIQQESVDENGNRLPTTVIAPVGNEAGERSRLLASLGYEFSDFEMYDGWLILEESSAERVIRDHLVRWFAPGLTRVRPVAANGTGDLDRTFAALDKLVLFTHLQDRYVGRVLVLVDGDSSGIAAVQKLRDRYTSWDATAFVNLSRTDFEYYYPPMFEERVSAALGLTDKTEKRAAKRQLLLDVLAWVAANESEARDAFEQSAAEVLQHLRRLEAALSPMEDVVRS